MPERIRQHANNSEGRKVKEPDNTKLVLNSSKRTKTSGDWGQAISVPERIRQHANNSEGRKVKEPDNTKLVLNSSKRTKTGTFYMIIRLFLALFRIRLMKEALRGSLIASRS